MSLRRHGEIYPYDEGTTRPDRAPAHRLDEFQLAIPGGLLSSMARFRFTSQRHAASKTNTVQRESSEWQIMS